MFNQQERSNIRSRKLNNPDNDEEQDNSNLNQDFIKKGYLTKDIKTLKYDWKLEAKNVPDLKAQKRKKD